MFVVFLTGGIASGKSLVARRLEELGSWLIDLDQLSRDVLAPGEPCVAELARAFGDDLIDPDTGMLNRQLLASRAFASEESRLVLEAIEHPYITARLTALLNGEDSACPSPLPDVCVVEVQLLDRVEHLFPLADEIIALVCPLELRLARAIERGMEAEDVLKRASYQPSDDYLREHASLVIENTGSTEELLATVDAWWCEHAANSWSDEGGCA